MCYIDLHCHWDDVRFHPALDDLITGGIKDGITFWVSSALDASSIKFHKELREKYPQVLISAGIHPFDVSIAGKYIDPMKEYIYSDEKPIAVGECGLDFYDGLSRRKEQTELFLTQARWAYDNNLPMLLHIRRGYYEFSQLLRRKKFMKEMSFVFHSFSGPEQLIREFSDFDCYFSFSGAFTAERAHKLKKKLEMVAIERLFLESDAPYIKPVDLSGEYNFPNNIIYIYQKASEVLKMPLNKLKNKINSNFLKVFFG